MYAEIQKWGNSQGVRIPKSILQMLGWNERESVRMDAADGKLILSRPRRHKTIEERFAGFSGNYVKENVDWGEPEGKEVW